MKLKHQYGLDKIVKLASNENPFGCSEKVKESINEFIVILLLFIQMDMLPT